MVEQKLKRDRRNEARRPPAKIAAVCGRAWLQALLCLLWGTGALAAPAWHLVWSDEFNQANGTKPSSAKWTYNTGNGTGGWGNNELEYYTSRTNNARIEDGCLVIEALREKTTSGTNVFQYTSARLTTASKFATTYGRIEARMKIPRGAGLWPAFWMLGANYSSVPWPACGELDIMENIGQEPTMVHASAHGTGYSGSNSLTRSYTLPLGRLFSSDFHVFALEWETNRLRWLVDNSVISTITPASLPAGTVWAFDHTFFIILNLAVGGNWPGDPSATAFPQRVAVDYVRVYSRVDASIPALGLIRSGTNCQVSWPSDFPHANLQRTSNLRLSWTNYPAATAVFSNDFRALVEPGYYRLRIIPQ